MSISRAKAAKTLLWLGVVLLAQSCTTSKNRVSPKGWSQTAARADREQQISAFPQDGWELPP